MPTDFGFARLALTVIALAAGTSCGRRALREQPDAAGDIGSPSVGDTAPSEAPIVETAADRTPDLASDLATDHATDAGPDVGVDAPAAVCPPDLGPLDVCGCCCVDDTALDRACYYPALGQSRDTIPNPPPTPGCVGCSAGVRYVCCVDPGGPPSPTALYCGSDTSIEDFGQFAFTKRDGEECTTIQIGMPGGHLPLVDTPAGLGNAQAWRGPCGTSGRDPALGGLGAVTLRPLQPGDSSRHYDVHVVLFFDLLSGIARPERIDVDDIAVAPRTCGASDCPLCAGACAFDTSYRYGLVGGNVPYLDTAVLAPPTSYTHIRSSLTSMLSASCTPTPPACGDPTIDVADVRAALGDADVQLAFTRSLGAATTPFYGQDQRPVDGQAFQITRDGGGGFLIGAPCPAGSPPSSCLEIPGGLGRLETLLRAFDAQQFADPSCASLRP